MVGGMGTHISSRTTQMMMWLLVIEEDEEEDIATKCKYVSASLLPTHITFCWKRVIRK